MRGQAGFEYMLILAILMAILIPLFIFVNKYSASSTQDVQLAALRDSLQTLAEAADLVWSQGAPARITANLYIPSGVESAQISGNAFSVRVSLDGATDVTALSKAPLTGSIPTTPGWHKIVIEATEEGFVNVSY